MRMLLVNRALPIHLAGGLERHFEDLAAGLAGAGNEVHLLTAELPAARGEEERKRLAGLGLTQHEIKGVSPARYSLKWLRRVGTEIEKLHGRFKFDLVHAQEFAAGFWKESSARPPLVVTVHGTLTSETPLHHDVYPYLPITARPAAWLRYGRRFLFAGAWKKMLHAARQVLVDSEFTRGELVRQFPDLQQRMRVVPLGVPWTEEIEGAPVDRSRSSTSSERALKLVTLGRLEWAKGQDLAVEALSGLKQYSWHYTIAGEGSWRGRLEQFIRRLGLEGRVTLLGRTEPEQLRRLLSEADLFLWPERTHPAFGLVGMEAHLAGTPVLATRRGAIPEVLGINAEDAARWLVDEPTAAQFREKLEPLLAKPELLASTRVGLREKALARFSFQKMVRETAKVYAEAIDEPR